MPNQTLFNRRRIVSTLGFGGAAILAHGAVGDPRTGTQSKSTSPKAMADRHMPRVIDLHAHSMLPSWIEALRRQDAQGRALIEGVPVPQWSPKIALETMDANRIEAMVLSNPIGTKGFENAEAIPLARRMNDEMAAIVAAHPRRFGAFAVLPLTDIDASLVELDRALDTLKLDGVCLQTNADGVYFGDPRFEPLFAELNKRRAVVFVHPVGPKFLASTGLPFNGALLEFMFDSTRAVTSMIYSGLRQRYPDFTYIATHGGGTIPYLADRIETINIMVFGGYHVPLTPEQVRNDLRSIIYDTTAATSVTSLASLTELVSADNIVMGFDYPMRPSSRIAPGISDVEKSLRVSDGDLPKIARSNALRILPQLAKRLT